MAELLLPLVDGLAELYPPGVYVDAWLDEGGGVVLDESGEPVLLGPDALWPPLVGDGAAVWALTLTARRELAVPLTGDGAAVLVPVVAAAGASLVVPLVGTEGSAFTPEVATGVSSLALPLIGDGAATWAPVIAPAGSVLVVPLAGDGPAVLAPALEILPAALAPPLVGSAASLLACVLLGGQSARIVSVSIGCEPDEYPGRGPHVPVVAEGSQSVHALLFADEAGEPVVPEALRWRLSAGDGAAIVDWTEIAATTSEILVEPEHNLVSATLGLRRWLLVEARHHGGEVITAELRYTLRDLRGYPNTTED
ncbi:MAG: hypothetical protein AB7U65_11110 [Halothiobacillaceae bacterium]